VDEEKSSIAIAPAFFPQCVGRPGLRNPSTRVEEPLDLG
jgi:hypothetical protein